MSTIQVRLELKFEQLLTAIDQLSTAEKRKLKKHLEVEPAAHTAPPVKRNGAAQSAIQRRIAAQAAQSEAVLLARIEQHARLPEPEQRRYLRLRRKSQTENFTDAEWTELQALTEQAERLNVVWLETLLALAQKRGVDLDTVMRQLGLHKKRRVL